MSNCIRCAKPDPSAGTGQEFQTAINGEQIRFTVMVKDLGNCEVTICPSCVRKELVYWMAITAPTDPFDEDEAAWTNELADHAHGEGWGLDGDLHIVRDDDTDEPFADDDAAMRWVEERANTGSRLHQIARELHNRNY